MNNAILSIDLAKDVFEIAVTDANGKVLKRHRLKRDEFREFLVTHEPALVLMEACGSAHYWASFSVECGHEVKMIPAHYVSPYRRRGKSDRIDTDAILEAHRCSGIEPVPIRSVEDLQVQQLHCIREQLKKTRVQRINLMRGILRELGFAVPVGATKVRPSVIESLESDEVPPVIKSQLAGLVDELSDLEERMKDIERELHQLSKENAVVQRLQSVPGIGLLTSTALFSSVGSAQRFSNGRKLASWVGLTPREHSSGNTRSLGSISKQGDQYLRTLLVHGGRSVLLKARREQRSGKTLTSFQSWALKLSDRVGHNKATCAVANKLARICWAVWVREEPYAGQTLASV